MGGRRLEGPLGIERAPTNRVFENRPLNRCLDGANNNVTRSEVDAMASAGGTTAAVFADDAGELRHALAAIIEGITE